MSLTADPIITSARLEELLADEAIPVVHRALWLLLWEDGVRVLDLLALDVRDVRFDAAELVITQGGAGPGVRVPLSERAAALLHEVVGDRTAGPVFAIGGRTLSWEVVVQAAEDQGHPIHAFRTGGKRHRAASG